MTFINNAANEERRSYWLTQNFVLVTGIAIAFVLIFLVAISPNSPVYDEVFYIVGAKMLSKGWAIKGVLLAHNYNLAGPLYPLLHWVVASVTDFDPWRVRWVNVVLLGISLAALAYTLRRWGYDNVWSRVTMVAAFPPFWVCTGLALTEIPALTCASLSVATIAWTISQDRRQGRLFDWFGFALAGMLFGLAILGRQPYLPAAIGFFCIAAFAPRFRWPALIGAAAAVLVPLPVFLTWGGLVAPDARQFARISIDHGTLAFIYLSAAVLLIAPRYYAASWRWSLATALLAGLCAAGFGGLSITVAGSIAKHLPSGLAVAFQITASALLAGGGAATIVASVFNLWEQRGNWLVILAILLTLGLTSTSLAIGHQFSSRYLITAFPFALLALQPYFTPSRWAALRLLIGAAIGAFALHSYHASLGPTA